MADKNRTAKPPTKPDYGPGIPGRRTTTAIWFKERPTAEEYHSADKIVRARMTVKLVHDMMFALEDIAKEERDPNKWWHRKELADWWDKNFAEEFKIPSWPKMDQSLSYLREKPAGSFLECKPRQNGNSLRWMYRLKPGYVPDSPLTNRTTNSVTFEPTTPEIEAGLVKLEQLTKDELITKLSELGLAGLSTSRLKKASKDDLIWMVKNKRLMSTAEIGTGLFKKEQS